MYRVTRDDGPGMKVEPHSTGIEWAWCLCWGIYLLSVDGHLEGFWDVCRHIDPATLLPYVASYSVSFLLDKTISKSEPHVFGLRGIYR